LNTVRSFSVRAFVLCALALQAQGCQKVGSFSRTESSNEELKGVQCAKPERATPGLSLDTLNAQGIPKPGVILFSYVPENNAITALLCDSRREIFFAKANPKRLLKEVFFRKPPEERNTQVDQRCKVVWGPGFDDLEEYRKNVATMKVSPGALWNAAVKLGLLQIPSTGLSLAAGALASVTAASSFHEIIAGLESGKISQAMDAFSKVGTDQLGWTSASLLLFGFSRVASAATLSHRVQHVLNVKQSVAVSQFSEAFSEAYDETYSQFSEQTLATINETPEVLDEFMESFVISLNQQVEKIGIQPRTVKLALDALTVSVSSFATGTPGSTK
jgi:hypothetical protein